MNDFLVLYGANVVSSIMYNTGLYYKLHRDAKKKSMRKLKYKTGLSGATKKELKNIRKDFITVAFDGIKSSFIPLYNIYYIFQNIDAYDLFKEEFESDYDEIVENANEKEELARTLYLEMLREYKDSLTYIDEDMEEKLKDDNFRPSKKEFIKTLRYLDPDAEIK